MAFSGTVRFYTLPDTVFEERVSALAQAAVAVMDRVRDQHQPGLPDAAVEIWITDDLAAAVRSLDGQVLGVQSLADYGSVRLGDGRVMGKTMSFDEAHAQAVVVIDACMFRVPGGHGQALAMQLLGHELEHVRIGQIRAVGGPSMEPAWRPWESELLFRHASSTMWAWCATSLCLSVRRRCSQRCGGRSTPCRAKR